MGASKGGRAGIRVKDAVGRFGEEVACSVLVGSGCEVLDRNWRCSAGELDIVARDGDVVVFVEVKTRSTDAFGSPAEAVDRRKSARLRRLAVRWLEAHREIPDPPGGLRFDVIAVVRREAGSPAVDHFRDAF